MFGLRQGMRILILSTLVTGLYLTDDAGAADEAHLPPTVAAVIDYQRILQESAASKNIAEQMETRRKAYQGEISKEEKRLFEAEKELAKQRSILSEEALSEKQNEFETKLADIRKLTQERRRQLEQISAEAVNEVKKALIEIVTGIAEERGFNLVLPSSQVLFFSRQIDLTDEVLAKLDAKLPQVAIVDKVD